MLPYNILLQLYVLFGDFRNLTPLLFLSAFIIILIIHYSTFTFTRACDYYFCDFLLYHYLLNIDLPGFFKRLLFIFTLSLFSLFATQQSLSLFLSLNHSFIHSFIRSILMRAVSLHKDVSSSFLFVSSSSTSIHQLSIINYHIIIIIIISIFNPFFTGSAGNRVVAFHRPVDQSIHSYHSYHYYNPKYHTWTPIDQSRGFLLHPWSNSSAGPVVCPLVPQLAKLKPALATAISLSRSWAFYTVSPAKIPINHKS